MLSKIHSFKLWHVEVYNNLEGGDVHWHTCYNCFLMLHWQNRYDVLAAAVDPTSTANFPLMQQSLQGWADNGDDAHSIVNTLMSTQCYSGVSVIARYVDEWTYTDFADRFQ